MQGIVRDDLDSEVCSLAPLVIHSVNRARLLKWQLRGQKSTKAEAARPFEARSLEQAQCDLCCIPLMEASPSPGGRSEDSRHAEAQHSAADWHGQDGLLSSESAYSHFACGSNRFTY